MQRREWDAVLGKILTAIGASAVPLAVGAGCGGTVHQGEGEGVGAGGHSATGGAGAGGHSPTGGAAAGGLGAGGARPSAGGALELATGGWPGDRDPGSYGGTAAEGDAGVTTFKVPAPLEGCPRYSVTGMRWLPPETVTEWCSEEAAAEYTASYVCFAAHAGDTCSARYDVSCVANEHQGGLITRASFVCGPLRALDTGECCYVLTGREAIGRPFRVGGVARVAEVALGAGWAEDLRPDVAGLDAETRGALADAYAMEGLTEHASVASFARFALQCLACGAPADLVRDAQRAALDEVAHAEAAFGLASAYAGTRVGPGPLAMTGALDGPMDPVSVACAVASEGAIAETVSALLVAAARDAAEDPVVRAVLARIAEEELEHALLAWRYLRWALSTGRESMKRELARIAARAAVHVGFGAVSSLPGSEDAMRAHGQLPVDERRRVAAAALESVVTPAFQGLLALTAAPPVLHLSGTP